MMHHRFAARCGLSLINLIVVIAIILFVLGFLLYFLAASRQQAFQADTFNNLRQIAIAVHNYHDNMRKLPPIVGPLQGDPKNQQASILFLLLPYLEHDSVYRLGREAGLAKVQASTVHVFLERTDASLPANQFEGWATNNYAGNWMGFKDGNNSLVNITDGTSNTLMFAERYQLCNGHPNAWAYPALYYWAPMFAYYSQAKFQNSPSQAECDPALPQSIGQPGIRTAYMDGSARAIDFRISPRTWWLLCDPADNMIIGEDF